MAKDKFPKILLHLEGLAFFIISVLSYFFIVKGSWTIFIIFIILPDISIIPYLINKKIGAYCYNTIHNYFIPLILLGISFYYSSELGIQISIVWIAHISMDRALGLGLKYKDNFKHTHLNEM